MNIDIFYREGTKKNSNNTNNNKRANHHICDIWALFPENVFMKTIGQYFRQTKTFCWKTIKRKWSDGKDPKEMFDYVNFCTIQKCLKSFYKVTNRLSAGNCNIFDTCFDEPKL